MSIKKNAFSWRASLDERTFNNLTACSRVIRGYVLAVWTIPAKALFQKFHFKVKKKNSFTY